MKCLCQTVAQCLFYKGKDLSASPRIYNTKIPVVVLLIHIFWDVPGLPDPEDEGNTVLQNPGNYLSKHIVTSQVT